MRRLGTIRNLDVDHSEPRLICNESCVLHALSTTPKGTCGRCSRCLLGSRADIQGEFRLSFGNFGGEQWRRKSAHGCATMSTFKFMGVQTILLTVWRIVSSSAGEEYNRVRRMTPRRRLNRFNPRPLKWCLSCSPQPNANANRSTRSQRREKQQEALSPYIRESEQGYAED